MSRKENRRKSGERDLSGKFARGNPGGPGRPPGSPNRATLAGRKLLEALEAGDEDAGFPSALTRMRALLTNPDPRVCLGAERLVLGLLHGRPLNGADDDGDGTTRPDPADLALRLANYLAAAVAGSPEALEGDDPGPAA